MNSEERQKQREKLYKQWDEKLAKYKNAISDNLSEIRKEKAEIQKLKEEIYENMDRGKFIRDENRIIISAPEIIIGDLNQAGELNATNHSKVIIRSNNISLQGVGNNESLGSITNQATIISNISVDTGIDGNEEVVYPESAFLTQAKSVTIQSNNDEDYFYTPCVASEGININSDSQINLNAALPYKNRKEILEKRENAITNQKNELTNAIDTMDQVVKRYMQQIIALTGNKKKMKDQEQEIAANLKAFYDLNEDFRALAQTLSSSIEVYTQLIAQKTEINRKQKALKKSKEKIEKYEDDYDKENTHAAIKLSAENTSIVSVDADGKIRTNDGAGVNIRAKEVNVEGSDINGKLIEKSQLNIQTHDVNINTTNKKKGDNNSFDYTAEGDVHIVSKNIIMESVDRKQENDKFAESALTKEGSIKLRAENLDLTTHDTEGNAGGKFSLNSQDICLKSMNIDTEQNKDKELSQASNIKLIAENIYAGKTFLDNDSKCKEVKIEGQNIGITGKEIVEIQQDDKDASSLNMSKGSITVTAKENLIGGKTKVSEETIFESKTTQKDATIDNLTVNKTLQAPATKEGA